MAEGKETIKIGFIGVGQGGGNITNYFAGEGYPCLAINTAQQDLDELKNIEPALRLCFPVRRGGGAGKQVQLGEIAMYDNQQAIADQVKMVFADVDFIYVIAALGGGTGSIGCTKVLNILVKLDLKDFGLIAALPPDDEDYQGKGNAYMGIHAFQQVHRESRRFKGVLLVDNQALKAQVAEERQPYENLWTLINSKIFDPINTICNFTMRSGFTSFDPQDYRRLLDYKGYTVFAEGFFDSTEGEKVLASKVLDMWAKQNVFKAGKPNTAQGVAFLIERPAGQDEDGRAITQFFTQMQEYLPGCHICRGVYAVDKEVGWLEKIKGKMIQKPIRICTILTGIEPPTEFIKEFEAKAREELNQAKEKQKKVLGEEEESDFYQEFLEFYSQQNEEEPEDKDREYGVFTNNRNKPKTKHGEILNWDFKK